MQAATKIEISTVHAWIVFGHVDDLVLVSVRKKIHIVSAPKAILTNMCWHSLEQIAWKLKTNMLRPSEPEGAT